MATDAEQLSILTVVSKHAIASIAVTSLIFSNIGEIFNRNRDNSMGRARDGYRFDSLYARISRSMIEFGAIFLLLVLLLMIVLGLVYYEFPEINFITPGRLSALGKIYTIALVVLSALAVNFWIRARRADF